MIKPCPSDFQPPPYDPYEDDIDFMDLLRILWKWKYLILIGLFMCTLGAAIVSLSMTKIWTITTILQPGMVRIRDAAKAVYIDTPENMVRIRDAAKAVYIDTPENIKTVIETGALNGRVLKGVVFPDVGEQPTSVEFKVTLVKNSNAIEVTYETPNVAIGMQIMKNLNEGLLERYAKLVEYHREKCEVEIVQRRLAIKDQNAIMDATRREIQILDKTIDELDKQIRLINENSSLLVRQRDRFVSSEADTKNILSAILYTNTIQQNIALDKTSRDDLNQYRSQKETLSLKVEAAQNKIKNLEMEIKSIESDQEGIQNIQILRPPRASDLPVKPRTRFNVLAAGVTGLLLTIFLSFFVEYVSKYRKREVDASAS